MAGCASCLHKNVHPNVCSDCLGGTHFKPRKKTNADRVRAMSDEQLNAWFMGVCHAVAEFSCSGCQFEYLYGEDCGFLSWLKKEASDDSFVHTGP